MGKTARKGTSNPRPLLADLQNFVAITDIEYDFINGGYDVTGIARPYQQVNVQSFDEDGNNPSNVVAAAQIAGSPYGWTATGVMANGNEPWCFVAQGADGTTASTIYPVVNVGPAVVNKKASKNSATKVIKVTKKPVPSK
jgi:hypothetical protein